MIVHVCIHLRQLGIIVIPHTFAGCRLEVV